MIPQTGMPKVFFQPCVMSTALFNPTFIQLYHYSFYKILFLKATEETFEGTFYIITPSFVAHVINIHKAITNLWYKMVSQTVH